MCKNKEKTGDSSGRSRSTSAEFTKACNLLRLVPISAFSNDRSLSCKSAYEIVLLFGFEVRYKWAAECHGHFSVCRVSQKDSLCS